VRATFLTHYYPPEVGAPQARIAALARGLGDRGVAVTVHTCPPHYPDGVIRPGYRNVPWRDERLETTRIVRSAVYPAPNRGFARRLANHASFALSALATAPATGPADVVVVETPPLFLAGIAIPYASLKGAPLVVHVADLWPDSAVELGALRRPRLIAAARRLERSCYAAAAAIVCPTLGIAAELRRRPEAGPKVHRIAPSVDVERFTVDPRRDGGRFRILYAGTVGLGQGLDTLISAATRLADEGIADGEIEVVIAGDGADAPALRERLAREGPPNTRMIGPVPHERVPSLYAEADAAAVLLRDLPLFRGALPSKLLEAMAAARPVLLSAGGEAADLVQQAGAGLVVPPEQPGELARAIVELHRDPERARRMGAAGRRVVVERFGRDRAVEEWMQVLGEVAPQPAIAGPPAPAARRRGG
jgi:glycosyltransferase involved in cell wall biosynthesis